MTVKRVFLWYGPNLEYELNLNEWEGDYLCRTDDTRSITRDVIMAPNLLGAPVFQRSQDVERVFSVTVMIAPEYETNSPEYNTAYNRLLMALYRPRTEQIRVGVERDGLGTLYIDCAFEGIEETNNPGEFLITFKAADPIYTLFDTITTNSVTQPASGSYNVLPIKAGSNVYTGTAPSEPKLTLEVMALKNVWGFMQTVTVTNPGPRTLINHPMCIQLGNVTSWISAGQLRSDLADLRLQSIGGFDKDIWVRDRLGDRTDVKIWFIMNSIAPGETKTLRVLSGNPTATARPEILSIRPQFNMFESNNGLLYYTNFAPIASEGQGRAGQWVPFAGTSQNAAAIMHAHPAFGVTDPLEVPCAGAQVLQYSGMSGYAGMELNLPIAITQVEFPRKLRTNGLKTPFVLRSRKADMVWRDDFIDRTDAGQSAQLSQNAAAGATVLWVYGNQGVVAGDTVYITLNTGSVNARTVAAVGTNPTLGPFIQITTGIFSAANAGNEVTKYPTGVDMAATTVAWSSGNRPVSIMFGLRGDAPQLTSGNWYYAGVEYAKVTLDPAAVPTATVGARTSVPYQVSGTLSNTLTGETITIKTVMHAIGDKLVVDCAERTCKYYAVGNPAGVDIMDAVSTTAISEYWLHLEPSPQPQNITFSGENLYNLKITVEWPTRYY